MRKLDILHELVSSVYFTVKVKSFFRLSATFIHFLFSLISLLSLIQLKSPADPDRARRGHQKHVNAFSLPILVVGRCLGDAGTFSLSGQIAIFAGRSYSTSLKRMLSRFLVSKRKDKFASFYES